MEVLGTVVVEDADQPGVAVDEAGQHEVWTEAVG